MLPLLLLLLILIIAGAIARQGLLSAFLHLICVISAGAVAFALWEPIAMGFIDSTGGFSAYFAGTTLVLLFLIVLVIFRLSMDVLVPENLNFNKTVEWIGASIFGVCGSFLSVGILVIGVGFLQFIPSGFGYTGWARDSGSGQPAKLSSTPMIPAVLTARFYEFLSVGSFTPMIKPGPLAQYRPEIDRTSWSLSRDSYDGKSGNARIWIQPKSITIPAKGGFIYSQNFSATAINPSFPRFTGAYLVSVEVDVTAFDNGNQFTLSGSQARLIAPPSSSGAWARSEYPILFGQPSKSGAPALYAFDDPSNYVTSRAGQQTLAFQLIFSAEGLGRPLNGNYFLEIKGLRIKLPALDVNEGALASVGGNTARVQLPTGNARPLPANDVKLSNELPIRLSYNARGGLVIDNENKVTSGSGEFPSNAPSSGISRGLRVNDFFEPEGTRMLQLTVRRGGAVDTEQLKRDGKGSEPLVLVDSSGQTYYPAGYIKKGLQNTQISYEPSSLLRSLDQLPSLPSAGNTTLSLLFRVPVGSTIRELRVGDTPIVSLNVLVTHPK